MEQSAQKEEAYARATVALTRAQQICIVMGPLDMRGLVGAATIMGCLTYMGLVSVVVMMMANSSYNSN